MSDCKKGINSIPPTYMADAASLGEYKYTVFNISDEIRRTCPFGEGDSRRSGCLFSYFFDVYWFEDGSWGVFLVAGESRRSACISVTPARALRAGQLRVRAGAGLHLAGVSAARGARKSWVSHVTRPVVPPRGDALKYCWLLFPVRHLSESVVLNPSCEEDLGIKLDSKWEKKIPLGQKLCWYNKCIAH